MSPCRALPPAPRIINSMTTPGLEAPPHYRLKHGPYSSHSLLLAQLPSDGHGGRLLDICCASGYLSSIPAGLNYRVTAIDRCGIAPPAATEFIHADRDEG